MARPILYFCFRFIFGTTEHLCKVSNIYSKVSNVPLKIGCITKLVCTEYN